MPNVCRITRENLCEVDADEVLRLFFFHHSPTDEG